MRLGRTTPLRNGARHWAAPWVLVILGLRALIPAGFMLAPVEGHLTVVLCDAVAHGAVHHLGSHDHPGHHSHTQIDPTCPYAQSAGPAPLPALLVFGPRPIAVAGSLLVQVAQTHAQAGPFRQQSPRGPPHLA